MAARRRKGPHPLMAILVLAFMWTACTYEAPAPREEWVESRAWCTGMLRLERGVWPDAEEKYLDCMDRADAEYLRRTGETP